MAPVYGAATTTKGSVLYMHGGCVTSNSSPSLYCTPEDPLVLQIAHLENASRGQVQRLNSTLDPATADESLKLIGHTLNEWKNSLILFGGLFVGSANASQVTNHVLQLSLVTLEWTTLFTHTEVPGWDMPEGRYLHEATVVDSRLLITGGISCRWAGAQDTSCSNTSSWIYVFDLPTKTWQQPIRIPKPMGGDGLQAVAMISTTTHLVLYLRNNLALLDLKPEQQNWTVVNLVDSQGKASSLPAGVAARLLPVDDQLHIALLAPGSLAVYGIYNFSRSVAMGSITMQVEQEGMFANNNSEALLVCEECAWITEELQDSSLPDKMPVAALAMFNGWGDGQFILGMFSKRPGRGGWQPSQCLLSVGDGTPTVKPLLGISGISQPSRQSNTSFLGDVMRRVGHGEPTYVINSMDKILPGYIYCPHLDRKCEPRAHGDVQVHAVPGETRPRLLLVGEQWHDAPSNLLNTVPLLLWDMDTASVSRFNQRSCMNMTQAAGSSALLRMEAGSLILVRHEMGSRAGSDTQSEIGVYEWDMSNTPFKANNSYCSPDWDSLDVRGNLSVKQSDPPLAWYRDGPASLLAVSNDSVLAWAKCRAYILKFRRVDDGNSTNYNITSTLVHDACTEDGAAPRDKPLPRVRPGLVLLPDSTPGLPPNNGSGYIAMYGGSSVEYAGLQSDQETARTDLWLLDLATLIWVQKGESPKQYLLPSLAVLGGHLFMYGTLKLVAGHDSWEPTSDLWQLDLAAKPLTWRKVTDIQELNQRIKFASYFKTTTERSSIYREPGRPILGVPELQALVLVHPNLELLLVPMESKTLTVKSADDTYLAITLSDGDTLQFAGPNIVLGAPIPVRAQGVTLQGAGSGFNGTLLDCAGAASAFVIHGNSTALQLSTTTIRDLHISNCSSAAVHASVPGRQTTDAAKLGLSIQGVQLSNNPGAAVLVEGGVEVDMHEVNIWNNGGGDAGRDVAAVTLQAGALLTRMSNTFLLHNKMTALALEQPAGSSTLITGSRFVNNAASGNGGAIRVLQQGANMQMVGSDASATNAVWSMTVEAATFSSNTAKGSGGAVFFNSSVSSLNLTNVTLESNFAKGSGGGVAFATAGGSLTLQGGCHIMNNTAGYSGGGLHTETGTAHSLMDFQGMAASDAAPTVAISDTLFTDNSALIENGGALHHLGPGVLRLNGFTKNAPTGSEMRGIRMAHNNASGGSGGGVYAGDKVEVEVADLVLEGNAARLLGGGLACLQCSRLSMNGSEVTTNTASTGGGVAVLGADTILQLNNLVVENNTANNLLVEDKARSSAFTSATMAGSGGGLYLVTSAAAELIDIAADRNTARVGGGAYINFTAPCKERTNLTDCVRFKAFTVEQNEALGGPGGGLFVAEPRSVLVSCHLEGQNYADPRPLGNAHPRNCTPWVKDNKAPTIGGQDLASASQTLQAVPLNRLTLDSFASGTGFMYINATLLDVWGQVVQIRPPSRLYVEARLQDCDSQANSSYKANVQGEFNKMLSDGSTPPVAAGSGQPSSVQPLAALFTKLQLLADPGQYTVHFCANGTEVPVTGTSLNVTVRDCLVGEQATQKMQCKQCSDDQFRFSKLKPDCQACDTHGVCDKYHGIMLPKPGYWVSHPRSPQVHRCMDPAACRHSLETLNELQQVMLSDWEVAVNSNQTKDYRQSQCGWGYTGNLCAVCKPGYGRMGAKCLKCQSRTKAIWSQLGLSLIPLIVIVIQAAMAIQKEHKFELMKREEADYATQTSGEGMADPNLERRPGQGPSIAVSIGSLLAGGRRSDEPRTMEERIADVEAYDKRQKRALGSLKILIDYLQLLGIIATIQLDWPVRLQQLYKALNFSEVATGSALYCSLTGSAQERTVAWTVLSVLQPALYAVFVVLLLVPTHWLLVIRSRDKKGLPRGLRTALTICILCILNFFYAPTNSRIMSIFSFRHLDIQHSRDEIRSLTAIGTWWMEFPDMVYGKGQHALLLFLLAAPGVMIFALGVPLGILGLLTSCENRQTDVAFLTTYGLLYEDYRPPCYYWQVVVLLRQLLLVLCTVYLRALNVTVQVLTTLVVVSVYLHMQVMVDPYVIRRLSRLSGAMVLMIQVTLMLLLYMATNTGKLRDVIAILLILLNVLAFVVILLHVLFYGWELLLDGYTQEKLGRFGRTIAVIGRTVAHGASRVVTVIGQGRSVRQANGSIIAGHTTAPPGRIGLVPYRRWGQTGVSEPLSPAQQEEVGYVEEPHGQQRMSPRASSVLSSAMSYHALRDGDDLGAATDTSLLTRQNQMARFGV